jgi:hypothetical protein
MDLSPEHTKAAQVGKLDQECLDCFGGTAISTKRCWHCGSENIRYLTHHEQIAEQPDATAFFCGSRRATPEQFAKADAARWPKPQSI